MLASLSCLFCLVGDNNVLPPFPTGWPVLSPSYYLALTGDNSILPPLLILANFFKIKARRITDVLLFALLGDGSIFAPSPNFSHLDRSSELNYYEVSRFCLFYALTGNGSVSAPSPSLPSFCILDIADSVSSFVDFSCFDW